MLPIGEYYKVFTMIMLYRVDTKACRAPTLFKTKVWLRQIMQYGVNNESRHTTLFWTPLLRVPNRHVSLLKENSAPKAESVSYMYVSSIIS